MNVLHRASASRGSGSPRVIGFHEPDTGSCQYICIDDKTCCCCALIDVVRIAAKLVWWPSTGTGGRWSQLFQDTGESFMRKQYV